jgi:hypothetical protein
MLSCRRFSLWLANDTEALQSSQCGYSTAMLRGDGTTNIGRVARN